MVSPVALGFTIGASIFFIILVLFVIIKARYRKFTNREFVLRFRKGILRNQGYGGGYFLLPLVDELIVLTTTIQNLEIDVAEKIITAENQDVRVNGFVVWRIEDPVKAYQSISGSQGVGVMTEINRTLEQLVESIIRTTVARLTLDQVLRERTLIIEAIMTELVPVVGPMGILINTTEIRHVEVVDGALFHDLQESYRQEARLTAEQVKIETQREIDKSQALSQQQVRIFNAEQEEKASIRELERDRSVLLQEQKLNETEQNRMKVVQQLEKERETKIAGLMKDKLKIESETKLMQTEIDAESKKRKQILEEIQVEAEKKRIMAEAEAEAIRITAKAERDAAELRKEGLMAEAQGRKALLIAEAEGLKEKVKAQGFVNENLIMHDLVQLLPQIAASMKVGDVNWLNMGGGNGSATSPLGIIPNSLLQVLAIGKNFGLDVDKLMRRIEGSTSKEDFDNQLQKMEQFTRIIGNVDPEKLANAALIDTTGDNHFDALDLNHDNDPDFYLPPGVHALDLNNNGRIDGFDLNSDGIADIDLHDFLMRKNLE